MNIIKNVEIPGVSSQIAETGYKICSKCSSKKLEIEFRFIKKTQKLLGYCKACEYKEQCAWTGENLDRARASKKKWGENNREYVLASKKVNNARNTEKIKVASKKWKGENKERLNNYLKDWLKANPGKAYSYILERRMMKAQATPLWADDELLELVYAEAAHRGLRVDHIVPVQGRNVCGLHVYYNTQLLTQSENSSKGNRWPYESKVPL